jgi:dienelactone hydrolase
MRRILFLKMQMQGKKRSKVGHLARLFNAADAFSGAKYTRKSKCQDALKVVLDMARRGADLKAVVSFHGNLSPAVPALEGVVKAELLIEHAGQDSMVSMADLAAFEQEMNAAKVRYHVDIFDAKHGFTNPQATHNGEKNGVDLAYNEEAAAQSWQNMLNLLERVL